MEVDLRMQPNPTPLSSAPFLPLHRLAAQVYMVPNMVAIATWDLGGNATACLSQVHYVPRYLLRAVICGVLI